MHFHFSLIEERSDWILLQKERNSQRYFWLNDREVYASNAAGKRNNEMSVEKKPHRIYEEKSTRQYHKSFDNDLLLKKEIEYPAFERTL